MKHLETTKIEKGDCFAFKEGYLYVGHRNISKVGPNETIYVRRSSKQIYPRIPASLTTDGKSHQLKKSDLDWKVF